MCPRENFEYPNEESVPHGVRWPFQETSPWFAFASTIWQTAIWIWTGLRVAGKETA